MNKNKTMINFKGGDNYIVESRAEHLSNKEFEIKRGYSNLLE